MPSTSASKSQNIALRVHTFAANDLRFYSLSDGSCWMSPNFHLMNFIFASVESLCNDVRKFWTLATFHTKKMINITSYFLFDSPLRPTSN